jgi:hypothetical protein
MPPHRFTGEEVLAYMNEVKATSFDGYGTTHHWTNISNWWELPYFPQLLYPHNIDVMHIEKMLLRLYLIQYLIFLTRPWIMLRLALTKH